MSSNIISLSKYQVYTPLETDTLIESAFTFIAAYLGSPIKTENIYYHSLTMFENLLKNDSIPTKIYEPNEELYKKYIANEEFKRPSTMFFDRIWMKKIDSLVELISKHKYEPDVVLLDRQQSFHFATYFYLDNFLTCLDGDELNYVFPKKLYALNDPTVKSEIKNIIKYPKKFKIMPHPYDEPHLYVGQFE